jgi:hypothetical protein
MKTIVILGMHRSGTSMVAGILHQLGVDIGDELMEAGISNPFGHFEDKQFVDINNRILATCGGDWLSPPPLEIILLQKNQYSKEIVDLINRNKSELWGWKDPRTTLTIDLYLPYLQNPYFIVCYRNVVDIATSLQKRAGLEEDKSLKLIEIYNNRIDSFFKNHLNLKRLDLSYEDIRKNPHKEIENIIHFLGISQDEKKIQQATRFVASDQKKKQKKIKYLLTHPQKIPAILIHNIRKKRRKK